MDMTGPVVVVGPLAFDDVHAPAGHRAGLLGGSGAYASLAAAKYGEVMLVSIAGSDLDDATLAPLRNANVDLAGLERTAGRTLRWSAMYSEDFAQSTVRNTDLGVVSGWRPRIPDAAADAGYLFLANTDPTVQRAALDQLRPDHVVVDTMEEWIRERRSALGAVIARATIVSLNGPELTLLTGERDLVVAANAILAQGPRAVIAKRGARGAALLTRNGAFNVPAYPAVVLDPTGAGDALAGAFIARLARTGRDDEPALHDALVAGVAAASLAVETFGISGLARASRPDLDARAAWLSGRAGTIPAAALYESR